MKKYVLLITVSIILIFFSCENSVIIEQKAFIYQLPGCRTEGLLKTNYADFDSCFNYTFNQNLIVEFCVIGNCCPNENRFVTKYNIYGDSIFIAVKDTAANLCRCICNYIIRGEFQNLRYNEYVVKCIRDEDNNIIYTQTVRRRM